VGPSVSPWAGRLAGQAGSSHLTLSGFLWMAGMGGLAGLPHARGASLTRTCTAVALGAALGMVIALRAGTVTQWWTMLAAALVIALSALSHTEWALARQEPLRQRLVFVLTVLAVGARLWFARIQAVRSFAHGSRQVPAVAQGPATAQNPSPPI
jgi:hypothetical protein